ncbi:MAG: hypothetical protein WCG34_07580 [Leptolinea sp.]
MNKFMRFLIPIFCFTILFALLTSGCASSSNDGDKFILGGTFRLNENEKIDGNLSIFSGAVTLEKGSTINGNVILIGGTINAAGTINGGINGLGGSITLGDTAVVQGDVATVAAAVNKSDNAVIQGKIISQSEGGVQLPDVPRFVAPALIKPFGDALGGLLRALVFGALAVLVMLFMPRITANVGDAIVDSPFTAGAIGLLTLILFPFVAIVLAITIILIPLSAIAVIILALGLILGWIAIGLEMGNRIASLFKGDWSPAVSAGIGTMALSLLATLFSAIDCVGWVVPTIAVLLATGGVVMTAFGSRGGHNHRSGQMAAEHFPPVVAPIPPVNPTIKPSEPVEATVEKSRDDALNTNFEKATAGFAAPKEDFPTIEEPEKPSKTKARKIKPTGNSPESN